MRSLKAMCHHASMRLAPLALGSNSAASRAFSSVPMADGLSRECETREDKLRMSITYIDIPKQFLFSRLVVQSRLILPFGKHWSKTNGWQ